MSTLPAGRPEAAAQAGRAAAEIRAARAAVQRLPSGAGLWLLGLAASLAGAAAVTLFVRLDYTYGQAPHRLVKILIGAVLGGAIAMRPKTGLLLLPLAVPFLGWMPKLPVPGFNAMNALVFGVFGCWALHRAIGRRPVFRTAALAGPIGLFLAVCALAVVRGVAVPAADRYELGFWLLWLFRSATPFLVYFIATSMLEDEKDQKRMAWAIVIGLLLEAWTTVHLGRNGEGGRAAGSFAQSNELGAFLAMFTPLCLALLPAAGSWRARIPLGAGIGLGLWAEFLTLSRGGYAAMALGLLFVALRSSKFTALLIAAGLATSPFWAPDYVVDRVLYTTRTVEGTDVTELEGSAQIRINTWKAILEVIAQHPVDGVGFGGLAYVLPELGAERNSEVKDTAHNTFLRVQAEMGILGTLALLFLLLRCWRFAERGRRSAASPFQRQISIGFQGALVALVVSCVFGDRFLSVFVIGNFWALAALVEHFTPPAPEAAA